MERGTWREGTGVREEGRNLDGRGLELGREVEGIKADERARGRGLEGGNDL